MGTTNLVGARADRCRAMEVSLRNFCSLAFALLATALLAPAVAQEASADGNKSTAAPNEKSVAANLIVGAAPEENDEGWKHKDFSLDLTKGDVSLRVRVKSGTDHVDLGLKITREPDRVVVREGKSKTIKGKPKMVGFVMKNQPRESDVKPGSEFSLRLSDGPIEGLVEGPDGNCIWVQTTDPAAEPKNRHPTLGCIEMVINKVGEVESFRVWRCSLQVLSTAPADGSGAAPAAKPQTESKPPTSPEPEVLDK